MNLWDICCSSKGCMTLRVIIHGLSTDWFWFDTFFKSVSLLKSCVSHWWQVGTRKYSAFHKRPTVRNKSLFVNGTVEKIRGFQQTQCPANICKSTEFWKMWTLLSLVEFLVVKSYRGFICICFVVSYCFIFFFATSIFFREACI